MPSGSLQYILWRHDDNGHAILVCRFHSREQAERICRHHIKRGHKSLYRVTVLHPRGPGKGA